MDDDTKTQERPQTPRDQKTRNRPEALSQEIKDEIRRLDALGFGTRKIAKMLGLGRKQVRNILPSERPEPPRSSDERQSTTRVSQLDPFREMIREKVELHLTASRILREITKQGYRGSRTILADYVHEIRAPLTPKKKVRRRFETGPGDEIQVDWSPYQVPIGGKRRTVQAFSAVLGYSRKAFIRFYFDQRQSTLLEGHLHAFADFGGVTRKIVYDRMATIVLGTIGKDRKPLWHPRFLEFCRHHGFEPFLCKVRDPDRKGEVEAFFYYLERDFVRGSKFASLDEMNAAVRRWLDDIANRRIHGTIRRTPNEAWLEEKPFLIGLPNSPFPVFEEELRQVGVDATVSIRGTTYTVPARLAQQKVAVRLYAGHFEVLDQRGQVAMVRDYVSDQEKGRLVIDPTHYEGVRPRQMWVGGSVARMEDRFLERFPQLAELLAGIKLRMKSLFHIHLRSLFRQCEQWGEDVFLRAAERAQSFRRFDAQAVRRILDREHPLPEEEPTAPLGAEARASCELGDVDAGSLDEYAHLDTDEHDARRLEEGDGEAGSMAVLPGRS